MHHLEPSHPSARPSGRPRSDRRPAQHRRRTIGSLIIVLLLAGLVAAAPTVAARPTHTAAAVRPALPPGTTEPPDTEPPTTRPPTTRPPVTTPIPPPSPRCSDEAGFPRPTGTVPPGYVYTPTKYDGTVKDPQPDDTFVADAPGHGAYAGELRTRVVNGQEQLFVCAHVGTNTPDDALTPFATTGTGAHPATIAPRVVLIDSVGRTTSFDFGAAGTNSIMSHYVGSTDVHEGYAQMWVPLNANLREPGFVVRVEIRGTSALVPGGSTKVMGADEVFVHEGRPPTSRNAQVGQAVGVALDASAIGERPTDPGPDDLSALLAPIARPLIEQRIRAMAPEDEDVSTDGHLWSLANITFGSASLDSLGANMSNISVDVENFNATEGRGVIHIGGTLTPRLTVEPRSIGLVSIVSGSCTVTSSVDISITAGFILHLPPDGSKPSMEITFVLADGNVTSTSVSGGLWAVTVIIPYPLDCDNVESDIRDGVVSGMASKMQALQGDLDLRASVENEIDDLLTPADLTKAPLAGANVELPNGVGFQLNGMRYIPTAPPGHIGGDIEITHDGMNVAAAAAIADKGGTRFPYSYVPSGPLDLVSWLRGRTRPSGGTFDVGLDVSGATVNQLLRALTAGDPRSPIVGTTTGTASQLALSPILDKVDVGLLDLNESVNGLAIQVHPAASPMYLPTPPAGWPAAASSDVDAYVPSLRISTPVPGVATMAADVRMGMTATIDRSNHLVPVARASKVDVAPRFLRLGSVNVLTDPAVAPVEILGLAANAVKGSVPSAVGAALSPIQLPDLSVGSQQVHLDHLTVGTVGGANLGAFVDVEPGPAPAAPPALSTSWAVSGDQPPTQLVAYVLPGGMPLDGDTTTPARARWSVTDVNAPATAAPIYATAVGATDPLLIGPSAAALTPSIDRCTGAKTVRAKVSVTVTQDGVVRTSTASMSHTWPGTPPAVTPPHCGQDEPTTTTEPPDDTIPPVCRVKPWLCDDL